LSRAATDPYLNSNQLLTPFENVVAMIVSIALPAPRILLAL